MQNPSRRLHGATASIPDYNVGVRPASPRSERLPQERPHKSHIYSLEAAGILIIGALVLIFTLARYWHYIPWGAR
jgi:hypothetical protein